MASSAGSVPGEGRGGVAVVQDLEYAQAHPKQRLDMFYPAGASATSGDRLPVVVFVHGGGWKRGDRRWQASPLSRRWELYSNVGRALASRGVVVAVISYRLSGLSLLQTLVAAGVVGSATATVLCALAVLFRAATAAVAFGQVLPWSAAGLSALVAYVLWTRREGDPAVRHPDHADDVVAATRWVADHAATYGGDPRQLFLCGHSAGAHLVTFAALSDSHAPRLPPLRGIIGLSGPYNLMRMHRNPLLRLVYTSAILKNTERPTMLQASPVGLVTLGHAQRRPSMKFLLLNAAIDFHLARDGRDLHAALSDTHHDCEHSQFRNLNHQTIISCMQAHRDDDPVTPRIITFIERVVGEDGSPPDADNNAGAGSGNGLRP